MALIRCVECGKEISDKAEKCPNCGCPVYQPKQQNIVLEQKEDVNNGKIGLIGFIISFLGFLLSIGDFILGGLIAIIMGIVSLAKKEQRKGFAIAAIIISVVGFALSPSDSAKERNESNKVEKSRESAEMQTDEAIDNKVETALQDETEATDKVLQESFELTAGVYVVGEDIKAGKYDIVAVSGGSNIFIYDSYETYEIDGYPVKDYILGTGEITEGMEFMYSEKAANVRLKDGEVLDIYSGLTVEMIEK